MLLLVVDVVIGVFNVVATVTVTRIVENIRFDKLVLVVKFKGL